MRLAFASTDAVLLPLASYSYFVTFPALSILCVIFPASLPDIFTGIRTSISVAYTTLVAAEMVAANTGVGWMVLDAKNWFRNDIIFVGIIVLAFMGLLVDFILKWFESTLLPWRGRV